jgi:hypothetical protein
MRWLMLTGVYVIGLLVNWCICYWCICTKYAVADNEFSSQPVTSFPLNQ